MQATKVEQQKPFLSTKPRQESAAMNNNHKPHPASKEQLNKLTNRSSSKQRTFAKQAAKAPEPVERQQGLLPALRHVGIDGVDHLNFSSYATTELGKALSLGYPGEFHHSLAGNFANLDCFWYYVKSANDDQRLRFARSFQLKNIVKSTPLDENVQNFYAIFADGMYQRIVANQKLAAHLRGMDLPLDYYKYPDDGVGAPFRPTVAPVMIRCLEIIRKALQMNVPPCFHELLDSKNRLPSSASLAEKTAHANLLIRRRFVTEHQDQVMQQRKEQAEADRQARENARREQDLAEKAEAQAKLDKEIEEKINVFVSEQKTLRAKEVVGEVIGQNVIDFKNSTGLDDDFVDSLLIRIYSDDINVATVVHQEESVDVPASLKERMTVHIKLEQDDPNPQNTIEKAIATAKEWTVGETTTVVTPVSAEAEQAVQEIAEKPTNDIVTELTGGVSVDAAVEGQLSAVFSSDVNTSTDTTNESTGVSGEHEQTPTNG